jgi:hypothetical protein
MADRKATFAKRQREQDQKERVAERNRRKAERKAVAAARPEVTTEDGVDPDLIGIVPGPQPRPDDDTPDSPPIP